jgi:hypothetical protein
MKKRESLLRSLMSSPLMALIAGALLVAIAILILVHHQEASPSSSDQSGGQLVFSSDYLSSDAGGRVASLDGLTIYVLSEHNTR